MPYQWTTHDNGNQELRAWPHQSLPPKGFAAFIGATFCMILIPVFPLLGSVILWGVLPFLMAAVFGIWWALQRNWRDFQITETLSLGADSLHLLRENPRGPDQSWECNTYWAKPALHPQSGPVPHYLTLSGNGREVELGAFLSEEERKSLYSDLCDRLALLKKP